jgi:hypothetical protein
MQNQKNVSHQPPIRSHSENQIEVKDIPTKEEGITNRENNLNIPNHRQM